METIYSDICTSISDLKKSPSSIIKSAKNQPVAILNHNKPAAYLIPADTYERMLDLIEDIELGKIVKERENEESIEVTLDEL